MRTRQTHVVCFQGKGGSFFGGGRLHRVQIDQINFCRSSNRMKPLDLRMTSDTRMPDAFSTTSSSHQNLILPGELLSTILSQPLKLGPGLRHNTTAAGETVIQATQAGLLHSTKPTDFYIEYNARRVISFFSGSLTLDSIFQSRASR